MLTQFQPFPNLTTPRLHLRQLTLDDAPEIWVQRSDERMLRYVDLQRSYSLEDAHDFIQKINAGIAQNKSVYWSISFKDNRMLIGTICLWNFVAETSCAEIGYSLHPDFQGKGYMQEALERVLGFAFSTIQVEIIEGHTHPKNEASIRLLRKNNFLYAGESEGYLLFARRRERAAFEIDP